MALSVEPALPIEPSNPAERRELNLPPKQYADALVEGLSNGTSEAAEHGNYTGNGQATPTKVEKGHKRKKSSKDMRSEAEQHQLIEEKYRNGGLTSVPKDEDYAKSLELDAIERRPTKKNNGTQLVSGRKAGAGWERSG